MTDAERTLTVESIPSQQGGISAIGSAAAPFLYFENAPAFGTMNGIIKVTLTATRDMPVTNRHGGHRCRYRFSARNANVRPCASAAAR